MGKIKKLVEITNRMCDELGIQEGVDVTLGKNPARIYFTFEDTENPTHPNYGKPRYLNTSGITMDDVCKVPGGIADKYGLQRDKSKPKDKPGNKFALGFKRKFVQGSLRRYE